MIGRYWHGGKLAFRSPAKAMKYVRASRWGGRKHVYRCPYCGEFHLTSQVQR